MAKHEHGTMNYEVQEKAFYGFLKFVKWSIIAILATLVFLAIVGG